MELMKDDFWASATGIATAGTAGLTEAPTEAPTAAPTTAPSTALKKSSATKSYARSVGVGLCVLGLSFVMALSFI